MPQFFSTCAAGVESIADEMAKAQLPGYASEAVLPGALLYSAQTPKPSLPVFQNTYLVLAKYTANDTMDRAALRVLRDEKALSAANRAIAENRFSSFRYMFSDANRLSGINGGTRAQLERAITAARIDRLSPQTELLVLKRTEGMVLFLLRLTKRDGTEKTLEKGELSPSVSACMVHLVQPQPQHVFCDPFAGHGAIGKARLLAAPCAECILSDTDPAMQRVMRAQKQLGAKNVRITGDDAFSMHDWCPKGSVQEIATDPPWGLFAPLPLPAEQFYAQMLSEFAWALAPGGRLCVLSADKQAFEQAVGRNTDFAFSQRIDMLVNGKKAALYPAIRL